MVTERSPTITVRCYRSRDNRARSARPHVRAVKVSNAAFYDEGHRVPSTWIDDFIQSNHPVGLAKTAAFVRVFARPRSRKRHDAKRVRCAGSRVGSRCPARLAKSRRSRWERMLRGSAHRDHAREEKETIAKRGMHVEARRGWAEREPARKLCGRL